MATGRPADGKTVRINSVVAFCLVGLLLGLVMAALTLYLTPVNRPASDTSSEGLIPEVAAPGTAAPDFESESINGDNIRLSDLKGKAIALNFWATWCGPCLVEMPALQKAQDKYHDKGLMILAVNAGESSEAVSEFISSQHLTLATLLDPNLNVINLYDIRAYPTTIWITPAGIVEAKHLGPLDLNQLDQFITGLLTQS